MPGSASGACGAGSRVARRRAFGGARQRQVLLAAAEAEVARRKAEHASAEERRRRSAHAELVGKGVASADAEAALLLTECSAVRADAVLRVAYARYRTEEESRAAGTAEDYTLAAACHALYGVSQWLGGEPVLALAALREAREGGGTLEEAVERIVEQRQSEFRRECSDRLDAALRGARASQETEASLARGSGVEGAAAVAASDAAGATAAQAVAAPVAADRWPPPRCCRTHDLELRGDAAAAGVGPALAAGEAAELEALHASSRGDSWLVR